MTRILFSFLFILTVFNGSVVHSQTNAMAVEVAKNRIDITAGFTGSTIELFGDKRDVDADIVVVVEGPTKEVTIWQKERVFGAWVNRYFVKFKNIPAYYHYAISRQAEQDDPLYTALQEIGVKNESLLNKIEKKKSGAVENLQPFKDALLQKKINAQLYFDKPAKLQFINENFFRIRFEIPPSATIGTYIIHSYLIKNGKVLQHSKNDLIVDQVGLNAFVKDASKNHSLVYALICILFGIFSGWLVSVLKVKP